MCSFKGEFRCFSGLFPHMLQSTSSFVQSVKFKRKDWPWWTARCSAPCQSSAGVPCRPPQKKFSSLFLFLKFQALPSQTKLSGSSHTHTHTQTNQQICRKRADLKCCSGSRETVWSWMSAERECDTSQGCLGSVRGLLGGYRSEHTFTSRGREGGSRDDGRGARSYIPGARLNEERA